MVGGELAVGDQDLGLGVAEDEGDGARVEPVVERVQHRARHRHAVMRLEQRRHVGRHHRDRVARPDAAPAQRIGEPAAARIELAIGEAPLAVDDRELVRDSTAAARARNDKGVSATKFAAPRARCGAS